MALGAFGLTTNSGASDKAITGAGTFTCDPITGLAAMLAAAVQIRFEYGSGGTSVKVYLQTSFDGGNTWVDIACRAFTTASETRILNLSALTPKTTAIQPTDGTLTDDTTVDGVLGDRLRIKGVSVGTYAGQTVLSARVVAR